MLFDRFTGHLKTVCQHRNQVLKHCIKAGIPWRGLTHDLSKFTPAEFIPGVRYYQGNRSPNEREREVEGSSKAWMHHKGRNRHHFEYWTDLKRVPVGDHSELTWTPFPMPTRYVVEMFCDRIAASKVYLKDAYSDASPLQYFRREVGAQPNLMAPETYALLETLLVMLAEQGEDAAFAYIRGTVLKGRRHGR